MSNPQLTFVRVLSSAGPYRRGDLVAAAFVDPTVATLRAVETRPHVDLAAAATLVPESLSARIECAATPYEAGDVVTLSFVEPSVARLHRSAAPLERVAEGARSIDEPYRADATRDETNAPEHAPAAASVRDPDEPRPATPRLVAPFDATSPHEPSAASAARTVQAAAADPTVIEGAPAAGAEEPQRIFLVRAIDDAIDVSRPSGADSAETGPIVELEWTDDRAERFVQVIDKLFTVDRLGWYRHVLAIRLLIGETLPDDARDRADAVAALAALRTAGLDALGAPLLAAYLPGFAVTAEWLATLDDPALLGGFRALVRALGPDACAADRPPSPRSGFLRGRPDWSAIVRGERRSAPLDALVPHLVPTLAQDPDLSTALELYRAASLDLFTQIAPAPAAVRVRQMAQPNAVLDDRLWQLVGAVQTTLPARAPGPGAR